MLLGFNSVVFTVLTFSSVDSAKILAVFSTPSISHQVVFRPFTQELAKKGHEVTVITTDPAFPKNETPENLKEIDLHDSSYALWSDIFHNISTVNKDGAVNRVLSEGYKAAIAIFEAQMNNDEVQKLLNENRFDILIIEACMRPAIVLSHRYRIPLIWFSSFGAYYGLIETVAGPFHPLFHPDVYQHRLHNLSVTEKIKALTQIYNYNNVIIKFEEAETEMGRRLFGPTVPPTSQLMKNANLIFLNLHALWDNIRPIPSSVVHLGGLPRKHAKELPKDLKSYLDSSKNGVVYVSFGTNVLISQIPKHKREILMKVFSNLPYNVIVKWDGEDIAGRSRNLKLGKWFPQSDLLKHPNIKLFITQGGLQSTDEAITAGVPMIGIPMLGDQWYNVEQYEKFGIGIGLELETLTEEGLLKTIVNVIEDKSYHMNIVRFRTLVHDRPQSSLDRAMWWTEYLLRHGNQHLHSPGADMTLAQYLELELILSLSLFIFVIMILIVIVIKTIVNQTKFNWKIKHLE